MSARERETAADLLRRHFVNGRLSFDDFTERVRLALEARDANELRRAMQGLPAVWRDGDELRRLARAAKRRAVVATATALWALASFVLLVSFAVGASAERPTTVDYVGYVVAWLVVTAFAWRIRRRA